MGARTGQHRECQRRSLRLLAGGAGEPVAPVDHRSGGWRDPKTRDNHQYSNGNANVEQAIARAFSGRRRVRSRRLSDSRRRMGWARTAEIGVRLPSTVNHGACVDIGLHTGVSSTRATVEVSAGVDNLQHRTRGASRLNGVTVCHQDHEEHGGHEERTKRRHLCASAVGP